MKINDLILRVLKKLCGSTMCVLLISLFICGAYAAERPNIIIIFVDDMTFGGIGYENPQVKTPHLNALAAQGLILQQAFAASPICAANAFKCGVFT